MNPPLRRLSAVVLAMFLVLMGNITWLQYGPPAGNGQPQGHRRRSGVCPPSTGCHARSRRDQLDGQITVMAADEAYAPVVCRLGCLRGARR